MDKKNNLKLAFLASCHDKSQKAIKVLTKIHGNSTPEEADIIVTLGGDGFLLESIHKYIQLKKPFFPMNCGSIGYLLNDYSKENLLDRLNSSSEFNLHPLTVEIEKENGDKTKQMALNEASLIRMSRQASNIKIFVDGEERMQKLVSDGVLVATTVGSTAYNFSAGGEVLPLESDLLALTPICPMKPRQWSGAVLPDDSKIRFEVINHEKRPVKAEMDFYELKNVKNMLIYIDRDIEYKLLFDKEAGLEKKILEEQFPE